MRVEPVGFAHPEKNMVLMAPFVVLDQNVLRKSESLAPAIELARRTGVRLLVLDAAIIEMTKHPKKWEETTRKSLALLAEYPDLVCIGRGVSALMREERATGVPALGSLADHERAEPFRELLLELQSPAGGPNLTHLRANIADAQNQIISAQYLQHDDNKATLKAFRDVWKQLVPDEPVRRRMRDNVSDQLRFLLHPTLTCELEPILKGEGRSVREAQRIALDRSVSSHWLLALRAVALRWCLEHGLDSLAASKATNEMLDIEYVAIGSLCSELLSLETTVVAAEALVRAAGKIRAAIFTQVDRELGTADGDTRFRRHLELARLAAELPSQ